VAAIDGRRRAFAPQSRSQRPEKSLFGPVAPAAAATSEVEEQRELGWSPASTGFDGPADEGGFVQPPELCQKSANSKTYIIQQNVLASGTL